MGKKLFVLLLAIACLFCSACSGTAQKAQEPAEQDYSEARAALAGATDMWVWFETLFDKHLALDGTPALLEAYYVDAFRYYCRNGIVHLEFLEFFFGTHEDALADAMAIRNAYYEVKREYPDRLVSVIGEGLKYTTLDRALTDTLLDNALYIRENIKDDFDPDRRFLRRNHLLGPGSRGGQAAVQEFHHLRLHRRRPESGADAKLGEPVGRVRAVPLQMMRGEKPRTGKKNPRYPLRRSG